MDRMKSHSEGGKSLRDLGQLGRGPSLPILGRQVYGTPLTPSRIRSIFPSRPYASNSEGLNPERLYPDVRKFLPVTVIPAPSRHPLPTPPSYSELNIHPGWKSLDPDWINIETMGLWLRKCDDEHGGICRRPFGSDLSGLGGPKLLIDVANKCLVTSRASYRYACLSYVWGGASTLKTELHNLDSLMLEGSLYIHRDDIPRTIRDAISLTEQLGIPYIWIDALCIVQDDEVSKHDQIQAMAGIFANAYVTLIAGNGWDANHGLRGIQGVTEPRHLSSFLKSNLRENLQPYSSKWYSRGWTFQEMVFSPRKIMFQYQLAVWECNQATWDESSLTGISTTSLNSTQFSISPWKSQIQLSPWPDVRQYVSLVHEYTTRKLTYGEDGLNAISSLLSVMCGSFWGGFVSGLPEMFFNEALLW